MTGDAGIAFTFLHLSVQSQCQRCLLNHVYHFFISKIHNAGFGQPSLSRCVLDHTVAGRCLPIIFLKNGLCLIISAIHFSTFALPNLLTRAHTDSTYLFFLVFLFGFLLVLHSRFTLALVAPLNVNTLGYCSGIVKHCGSMEEDLHPKVRRYKGLMLSLRKTQWFEVTDKLIRLMLIYNFESSSLKSYPADLWSFIQLSSINKLL